MKTVKAGFHTPMYSGANGGCWDVAHNDDRVLLRDSKDDGKGQVLEFTRKEWLAGIAEVEAERWPAWVTPVEGGGAQVRMPGMEGGPVLTFDEHEMETFAKSVRGGDIQMIGPRN